MMRNKNIHNFLLYTFMTIFQKLVSFLMLPVIAIYLSPSELGYVNQVIALGAIYVLLFTFALDETAARYYFEQQNKKNSSNVGSIVSLSLLVSIGGGIIILIFNEIFYKPFMTDITLPFILLSAILIISSPIYTMYIKLLRIQEKAKEFIKISFIYIMLQVSFIVLFVIVLKFSAIGYMMSLSFTSFLMFIYINYKILHIVKLEFNTSAIKEALKYSVKIVPHTLSSWGLSSFTIIVLGLYLGSKAVGLYSIIYYLAVIVTVLADSLLYTYQPWLYKLLEKEEDTKEHFIDIITIFNIIFIIFAFFLALFSGEIIRLLFSAQYYEGIIYAPIIIYSSVILFMGSLYAYVLYYYKKATIQIAKATIIGSISNIFFSLVLVPILGIMGASLSLLTAQVIIAIIKQKSALDILDIHIKFYNFYFLSMFNIIISLYAIYNSFDWKLKGIIFIIEAFILILLYKKLFLTLLINFKIRDK